MQHVIFIKCKLLYELVKNCKYFSLRNHADWEERGKLVIRENDVAAALSIRGIEIVRIKNIKAYFFLKSKKEVSYNRLFGFETGIAIATMSDVEEAVRRRNAVADYRKKLLQHKELESRVRSGQSHSPNFRNPST